MIKYSDQIAVWLKELGYTHCFFVAGGNIMHLVESCSRHFVCIPVVHEVSGGIAVEYFNEVSEKGRAFALVTAGPGLTNIITAMAGGFLESRELLVLGGQVKVPDLARGQVRQRGIQEIDGVSIAKPVAVKSLLMDSVWDRNTFVEAAEAGAKGRKGPVFLEIPLDIQGKSVDAASLNGDADKLSHDGIPAVSEATLQEIVSLLSNAKRPVLLLGGGITREVAAKLSGRFTAVGIPLMLTWHAMDRIPEDHPMFAGRPNTWGQRSANILIQQADLLIALGTRLGLQQTGFNWQSFMPVGKVVHVDCDPAELSKGHPRVTLPVCGDANAVLEYIAGQTDLGDYSEWLGFCREVRSLISLDDPQNQTASGYISPYEFCLRLSDMSRPSDVVIPCSSGGANTVMQQSYRVKAGQRALNSGGLASMGYGLAGSIGAALAADGRRTLLVEGDGGFLQNLQELGTVSINRLNLKIFLFDNHGYASIRMTQRNYFSGHYVGCDDETGLYTPIWKDLFSAYRIPLLHIGPGFQDQKEFQDLFSVEGPAAFIVSIDPEQTYFPKISSRVGADGTMESNPLHLMSPDLPSDIATKVFRYIAKD